MARRTTRKRKQTARPQSGNAALWRQYQDLMVALATRLGDGFAQGIRNAIKTHDRIAAEGYRAWRLANHPAISNRALEPLRRRYAVADCRRFAALLMEAVKEIDGQYVRRFRIMLQSVFDKLDALLASGDWRLPDVPTREQIEAKIIELGGSENAVPTIHRQWTTQQSASVKAAAAAREEEERQRLGFATVEELRAWHRAQDESRRQDTRRRTWRRVANQSVLVRWP